MQAVPRSRPNLPAAKALQVDLPQPPKKETMPRLKLLMHPGAKYLFDLGGSNCDTKDVRFNHQI